MITKPDSKMRVYVLWMVFSVAFASARNSGCETSAGEYGTCIPVESCSVGTKRLDNGALAFDRHLLCGQDDDGPLICCGSTGRIETTTQKPDVTIIPTRRSAALAAAGILQRDTIRLNRNPHCVTPNRENGSCIPLPPCSPILTTIGNIEFIRQSTCGYYKTIPLVCCGFVGIVESVTKESDVTIIPTRRSAVLAAAGILQRDKLRLNRNPHCVIPNRENGSCIQLPSCSPILTSIDNIEFIRKSNCGYYKTIPLVCCGSVGQFTERAVLPLKTNVAPPIPTEPPLPNLKENAPCLTPNKENGTCISILSCSSFLQSLNKTKQGAEFARKSKCGVSANIPLVCCKSEKATRPSFHSRYNSRCVTPNNEEGVCKPFLSCISIQQLISGKEKESIAFAINSQCGIENGPLVCCSNRPPNQVKLSSSAISLSQNEPCLTPNRERGNCIPVNSCTPIKKAIKFFDPEAILFARASQCGYETSPMVCCGSLGVYSDPPPSTLKYGS